MIGIDTNVLIRFLVQDDPHQSEAARSLFQRCSSRNPGFIGREVLIETVWMLEHAYNKSPVQIATVIQNLLEAEELIIEQPADVATAAAAFADGVGDFADHLIAAAAVRAGCTTLYSFKRRAARNNAVTLLVK